MVALALAFASATNVRASTYHATVAHGRLWYGALVAAIEYLCVV